MDSLALGDELPVRPEHREGRRRDRATVHERVGHRRVHEPAPRARADERPDLHLAEHPREVVAARARELVRHQHLGAKHAARGQPERLRARGVVRYAADGLTVHDRDHVVVEQAAAVEPLVDHRPLPVLLREVVPVERRDRRSAGVRHPHVGERSFGKRIDAAAVVLHPRALS